MATSRVGFAAANLAFAGATRHRVADDGKRQTIVRTGTFGARCNDGKAVHRCAIEARDIHVTDHIARQDTSGGDGERDGF